MGASRRLVALSAAAVFAVMLAVGISVLSLFPRVVLGGFLLLLGLSFLVEWLYDAWFELPKSDYFLVIVILLAIATFELLEGVAVGLVVAIVLFVINYSRIDVTKHTFSGANRKSYVQRSRDQELLLQERGEKIYILELQGFIFFGTANKLLKQVRERLGAEDQPPLRFLVLDFRLVNGLDSSVVVSFAKLRQIAQKENLAIALTNLQPAVESQLKQGEILESEDSTFRVFADLDRGLEWCEDRLLEESKLDDSGVSPLPEQLRRFIAEPRDVETLMGYFQYLEIAAGETLFHQGDPSDGLYFLESGRVSVVFELEDGSEKRVQTYTGGTILGEMGLYQNAPRSASVIAEENSDLYHLSTVAFEKIETEQPQLAQEFHKAIVRLLSARLKQRSAELQHLLQ
jgi:SulP family sulfate permease